MPTVPVPLYGRNAPPLEKVLLAAPKMRRRRDAVRQPSAKKPRISKVITRKKLALILLISNSEGEPTDEPAEDRVGLPLSVVDEPLPELPAVNVPSLDYQPAIGSSADIPGSSVGDVRSAIEANNDFMALLISSGVDVMTCVQAQELPITADPTPLSIATTQAVLPPSSQRNVPAYLADRLKEMMDLLEKPIYQLVQSVDRLHVVLDAIAARLPSDLRQILFRTADLGFHREEITAASARIIARQRETAIRKEIAEESSALCQQKIALADDNGQSALSLELQELMRERSEIAEEIQRLQQKLSAVDGDIATRKVKLQRLDAEKRKQEEEVESRLAALQARKIQLTPGNDDFDRAMVAFVDATHQQALDALSSFLQ
ncbi:hypothetical protein PVAP13_3KG456901 [Panicum virgatum]|uniref:Uncharacterized protein n=1 Tax=Panicum virgatum TaxID=38727 RepID=A0A8T0V5G8_PANVG|nr:hypothetical protein PVAP13_3KG456901 [Panicum virgatum]